MAESDINKANTVLWEHLDTSNAINEEKIN